VTLHNLPEDLFEFTPVYMVSPSPFLVRYMVVTTFYITPWLSVHKRTITTGTATGPQILVPTFVDRGVSHGQLGRTPTAVNLSFLYWTIHFTYLHKLFALSF
jgi:hypothetical protein